MSNYVQKVRDAIDLIDATPYGKLGALFDAMATDADKAVSCHAAQMAALDGMVLVCGRTGDAFYDFEEQASAFYDETGTMRPGKSVPMEMDRDDIEERRIKYNAWVKTKIEAGRAALSLSGADRGGVS